MGHLMSVVLAADEGKKIKSKHSKFVHKICGKPMIEWVLDSIKGVGINESFVVIDSKADEVRECIGEKVTCILHEAESSIINPLEQALAQYNNKEGLMLVVYGDTPLITSETLSNIIKFHKDHHYPATVTFAKSESTKGVYCFSIGTLMDTLKNLKIINSSSEYSLAGILEALTSGGSEIGLYQVDNSGELLCVDDRSGLFQAADIMRKRIASKLMESGVTIINPSDTYIDAEVEVGMDTVIYPGTIIEGKTIIGEDCIIGPNSRIVSSQIGNNIEINASIILKSEVDDHTHIGPFAYIRPGSRIGKEVKIGDFVEIKNSSIGDDTKISHLTYVGDADIGKNVNLGCGVVVVNYDGRKKHKTIVNDNAFIGCNVNLVSPVQVGDNAYIAAGSTITDQVPANALAIAREKQVVKEEWVTKKGLKRG